MMYLNRATIDAWTRKQVPGVTLVKLNAGDMMYSITGPAIVQLTVWRDGDWTIRPLIFETPETIHWSTL